MQRIDGPTAAQALPVPSPVSGTPGFFTGGSPATNTPATNLTADFLNMIQEELVAIVIAGDLTPDKANRTQVLDALANIHATIQRLNAAVYAVNGLVMARNGFSLWGPDNDGAGSGLDADLFDGQDSSVFAKIQTLNAALYAINGLIMARNGFSLWGPDNDGAGSGLDADLFDGQESSVFAKILALNAALYAVNGAGMARNGYGLWGPDNDGAGSGLDADLFDGQDSSVFAKILTLNGASYAVNGAGMARNGYALWGPDNDGSGSGLDADTVDGRHASDFTLQSSFGATFSSVGHLKLPNGLIFQWGDGFHTDDTGAQIVNFEIPFPNACLQVVACNEAQGVPVAFHGTGNLTKTGFTGYSASSSGVAAARNTAFRYQAIGF